MFCSLFQHSRISTLFGSSSTFHAPTQYLHKTTLCKESENGNLSSVGFLQRKYLVSLLPHIAKLARTASQCAWKLAQSTPWCHPVQAFPTHCTFTIRPFGLLLTVFVPPAYCPYGSPFLCIIKKNALKFLLIDGRLSWFCHSEKFEVCISGHEATSIFVNCLIELMKALKHPMNLRYDGLVKRISCCTVNLIWVTLFVIRN